MFMMNRARTQAAKDQRRQVLLDAALDEFYERGFTAARMDDIANRAGLSKGTIYLYFDSKTALFTSLVESLTQPNVEIIETLARSCAPVQTLIREFTDFAPRIVRNTRLPRLLKVLIGDSQAFPQTIENYRKNVIERVLAALTTIFTNAKKRGEITLDNPELTARLLVAPVMFSGVWIAVFEAGSDTKLDVERLFQHHAEILLRALSDDGNHN